MKAITESARGRLLRLAWFFGLWAAGVAVVGVVAGAIRWWLFHG